VHGERSYQLAVRRPVHPPPRAKSGVVVRGTGEFLPGQIETGAADESAKQRNRKR
jgi:hypothetical protein